MSTNNHNMIRKFFEQFEKSSVHVSWLGTDFFRRTLKIYWSNSSLVVLGAVHASHLGQSEIDSEMYRGKCGQSKMSRERPIRDRSELDHLELWSQTGSRFTTDIIDLQSIVCLRSLFDLQSIVCLSIMKKVVVFCFYSQDAFTLLFTTVPLQIY